MSVSWDLGKDLDVLIEENVFGRKPSGKLPPYSMDPSWVPILVQQMGSLGWGYQAQQFRDDANGRLRWRVWFARRGTIVRLEADTKPLAVCGAALEALSGAEDP